MQGVIVTEKSAGKYDEDMKKIIRSLIGSILIIVSMLCFFYPNLREIGLRREVKYITEELDLQTSGQQLPEEEYSADKEDGTRELWEKLTAYNQSLVSEGQKLKDVWSYEQPPVTEKDMPMKDLVIGSISIPDMNVSLPLLLGASKENLTKGAAVLSETSMPVGGKDTNCVIAAHRGWYGSAYFQYIEQMQIGSKVYITNPWGTLTYEATEMKITDPYELESILIQKNRDMVTLITCHPYAGDGSQRYIVFCDRVTDGGENGKNKNSGTVRKKQVKLTNLTASEMDEKEEGNSRFLLVWEKRLRVLAPVFTLLTVIGIWHKSKKRNRKK